MSTQIAAAFFAIMLAEDLNNRILALNTFISDETATKLIAKILFLNNQDGSTPIRLCVNSNGGSATASLAILRTMREASSPIQTEARGEARGMALWIVAAGSPTFRKSAPNAKFSIEPIRNFTPAAKSPAEQTHINEMILKLKSRLVSELAQTTCIEPNQLAEYLEFGQQFSADEAMACGIVDQLLKSETPN